MFLTDGSTSKPLICGAVRGQKLRRCAASGFAFLLMAAAFQPCALRAQSTPVLLDAMTSEMQRAFTSLGHSAAGAKDNQLPPYFMSYSVADADILSIRAEYGALEDNEQQ